MSSIVDDLHKLDCSAQFNLTALHVGRFITQLTVLWGGYSDIQIANIQTHRLHYCHGLNDRKALLWVRSEFFFPLNIQTCPDTFSILQQVSLWLFFISMRLVSRLKRKSDLMAFYFRPGGNKHSNIWQGVWMFPISTVWDWNDTFATECHWVCIINVLTLSPPSWPFRRQNMTKSQRNKKELTSFIQ